MDSSRLVQEILVENMGIGVRDMVVQEIWIPIPQEDMIVSLAEIFLEVIAMEVHAALDMTETVLAQVVHCGIPSHHLWTMVMIDLPVLVAAMMSHDLFPAVMIV